MNTKKTQLIGLTLEELEQFVTSLKFPRYRADQLFNWIYKKRVTSFDDLTNFSKKDRAYLGKIAEIGLVQLYRVQSSANQETHKFLFQLKDGLFVESVFIIEGNRRTVCLSSQVGCGLNCKFCATAKMGLLRNLSSGEIVDQLLFIQRYLKSDVSNIVLMGMGEPFLNYENVIKACDIISHDKGIAIGKRKITISTSGIVPAIKRFTDEGQKYRLAISLNAATNETRNELMPINKKYPLGELINAAKYYARRAKSRITFEYVLIGGVNDTKQDALKLKRLLGDLRCKINIIPYNLTDNLYRRPSDKAIDNFIQQFLDLNIVISVRRSKGDDIDAACGQLYHKTLN